MAWQDEMTILLRVMIGDTDIITNPSAVPTYTDDSLQRAMVASSQLVLVECGQFTFNYIPDLVNVNIAPDPTDRTAPTRDDSFINLVCLKSASIIERAEARKYVQQGVEVRDGTSQVNLWRRIQGAMAIIKSNYTDAYETARMQYLAGEASAAGAAIMTPFRLYADNYGGIYPFPWDTRGSNITG